MSDPAARNAIRLSGDDNVVTVLRAIEVGEAVVFDSSHSRLEAGEAIPLCHKVALAAIAPGEAVVKYGQPIGRAVAAIAPGAHVHVHNMRSARAQGTSGDG